jgi:hypothetical protein
VIAFEILVGDKDLIAVVSSGEYSLSLSVGLRSLESIMGDVIDACQRGLLLKVHVKHSVSTVSYYIYIQHSFTTLLNHSRVP